MKKYQVKINNMELEIIQDDDGKFITPYLCIEDWGKFGTCLKPSFEPIIVARKPFKGSLVDNVIEYGVGGINIDECRIPTTDNLNGGGYNTKGTSKKQKNDATSFYTPVMNKEFIQPEGRFPANTILTYDETNYEEVCGGFPITNPSKQVIGGANRKSQTQEGRVSSGGWKENNRVRKTEGYNDNGGSASRYFYTAKASKKDRDEGLDTFIEVDGDSYQFRQDGSLDGKIPVRKNTHPTVKPTELMQYLVRLVSPNGATILDPFNGSGSTGKAVMYENKERNKDYKYIGIELTEEYLPISKARIEYVCNLEPEVNPQMSIFDLEESR